MARKFGDEPIDVTIGPSVVPSYVAVLMYGGGASAPIAKMGPAWRGEGRQGDALGAARQQPQPVVAPHIVVSRNASARARGRGLDE